MDDFELEIKNSFLEEAEQSINDVEQCFLILETNPNDTENLNKIFRLAHNLKGSSKAVGFLEFSAFTHEFESFILKIKNGQLVCTKNVVNLLLAANDFVVVMINGLKKDINAQFNFTDLLNQMKNYSEQTLETPAIQSELNADPTIEEILAAEELRLALLANQPVVKPIPIKPQVTNSNTVSAVSKNNVEESIRVALSKVDSLLNAVGEMVILQNVLNEQVEAIDDKNLRKTVSQLYKISKEIQDSSMSLRLIPIKPTFQKMQRIVRDTAGELNKDISIILQGEETELDKTVLEKMNDPLVHLIRNSVDHGIESKEIRLKNGKSEKGTVTLSAYHHSGKLVIEVSDDGGGLNPEKLIAKAIQKNIISQNQKLTDLEAMNLIFAPGFSTKEAVTDVSGRGVGMDVVKTNIQELSGEIKIFSELGKGTTFKISLPLTLSIIDSLIVKYSENKFIIPLGHVFETVRPTEKMIQFSTNLGDTLLLRGECLPMFRLGDFFGLKNSNPLNQMIALVIRLGATPFVLLVDDILTQTQIVTKQLGLELQGIKGISGSTILADGKPALILETVELLQRKKINGYVNNSEAKNLRMAV